MDRELPIGVEDRPRRNCEQDRFEAMFDLCRQARDRLEPQGSFRLRVLLDMVLLELRKETEQLDRKG